MSISTNPLHPGLGHRIRTLREAKGLTQIDLAAHAGVNPETINRLENGGNWRGDTIEKISRALPALTLTTEPDLPAALDRQRVTTQEVRHQFLDLQTRTTHLIHALVSIEHLQKIQAMALRMLANADPVLYGTVTLGVDVPPRKPSKSRKAKKR